MLQLSEIRHNTDEVLRHFLAESRTALVSRHTHAGRLVDEISRLLNAGGKRIRPVLCCLAYFGTGGADTAIFRAGASLELLHTFALVHDDLMDGASERRRVPTTHSLLGDELAILVGDLAYALSDQLFWESGFCPKDLIAAASYLHSARLDAIAGQHLDLENPTDLGDLATAARLKTASYSIVGPLQIGATLAGAAPGHLSALREFGLRIGEAYQLLNDLAGKSQDERSGRMTTLAARGEESTAARAKELFAEAKRITSEHDALGLSDDARVLLNALLDRLVDYSTDERGPL